MTRKLAWQHGGAKSTTAPATESPIAATAPTEGGVTAVPTGGGIGSKIRTAVVGIIKGLTTGGLSTLFGLIVLVLEVVGRVLWFLFTVVVPYLVMYIGIPLFILGAIMALIFTVGHIFFLVAFFVGVYLYTRGLLRVALPSSIFHLRSSGGDTQSSSQSQPRV